MQGYVLCVCVGGRGGGGGGGRGEGGVFYSCRNKMQVLNYLDMTEKNLNYFSFQITAYPYLQ